MLPLFTTPAPVIASLVLVKSVKIFVLTLMNEREAPCSECYRGAQYFAATLRAQIFTSVDSLHIFVECKRA